MTAFLKTLYTDAELDILNAATTTRTAGPAPIRLNDTVYLIQPYRGFVKGTAVQILGQAHVAVNLDGYRYNPVDFHTSEIVS